MLAGAEGGRPTGEDIAHARSGRGAGDGIGLAGAASGRGDLPRRRRYDDPVHDSRESSGRQLQRTICTQVMITGMVAQTDRSDAALRVDNATTNAP